MAASRAELLVRKPGQPPVVSYLELFFDLVFVFALTQLSRWGLDQLASQHQVAVAGQAVLLLLALMMVWLLTAWITNVYDPQRPEIQLVVATAMFGALVMAVALPEAFGPKALEFAGAYVTIHIGRGLVLVPLLRGQGEAQRRAAGTLLWFAVSAVWWIVGATADENSTRVALWALALAIEYTGAMLFFPAPWVRHRRWPVVAKHIAERYLQFFIITLGELIAVTGATNGANYLESGGSVAAFFISFVTTLLLWRTYLYRAGALLPAAIAAAPAPARLTREALLAHLIMVAGIVAADAGFELVIAQPMGHTSVTWIGLIVGGPAVFLAGRVLFGHAIFARVSESRVIGALLLALTAPAMIFLPPLAVAIMVTLVLVGIVVSDVILARGRPPKPPSPPDGRPTTGRGRT
ncbi:low temperature requirement protein A [Phytohabitans sp. ZYX-F-186]|uniref:Low temperature requirement protein A n=1 Tax=Phytohabitans maris TaxID=3071409 RepID=A0ABU0ZC38_9ACTN|nr:low temperature requirement protein A [Phytohabitans sp. ZYX-F-186]MDQ7904635.1 low temperature requirement protein A [Phytohabitans sp. ZYX-F-186]